MAWWKFWGGNEEDDGADKGKNKKKAKRLTPRQIGRRWGCAMATIVILLQLVRIYLKHKIKEERERVVGLVDSGKTVRNVTCASRGENPFVPSCSPSKCGRVVLEKAISPEHCAALIQLAEFGMSHGGGDGGATILDFPSGALSRGDQFVNLHQMLKSNHEELPQGPVHLLQHVIHMVKEQVTRHFGVENLLSTTPRFVSRMDESPAKTMHDEYWHEHIDANQYPGFEYTALVYLNKQGVKPGDGDFTGGEFSFVDPNHLGVGEPEETVVRPECGKLVFFTSGAENVHHVHKVLSGQRYALTIAFTCDSNKELKGKWS